MKMTANMVPIISKAEFDDHATAFLKKYCPEALTTPMAVPVNAIASDRMGLKVEYHSLSEDTSEFGQIFFTDGGAEIYLRDSDEYIYVPVTKGTIFLDPDLSFIRSKGSERYTLTHECVHWHLHRKYHMLNAVVEPGMAVAHRCPKDFEKREKKRTDIDWMEWQAEGIAAAILMPRDMFRYKVEELVSRWMTPEILKEAGCLIENHMISELALFFNVSQQAAKIRASELGCKFL